MQRLHSLKETMIHFLGFSLREKAVVANFKVLHPLSPGVLGETSEDRMASVHTNTRTSPPHLDQEPRLTSFTQN
jgi:hypothetical protein